jgi:hypothetical protein
MGLIGKEYLRPLRLCFEPQCRKRSDEGFSISGLGFEQTFLRTLEHKAQAM